MTQQNNILRMRMGQSKSFWGLGIDAFEIMATSAPKTIPATPPNVAPSLIIKILYPRICTVLDSDLDDILEDLHKVSYVLHPTHIVGIAYIHFCIISGLCRGCQIIPPLLSKPPVRYAKTRLMWDYGKLP